MMVACSSDDNGSGIENVLVEAGDCTYHLPGNLLPNTGQGIYDTTIWAPDISSPFGLEHSVARSQVYSSGGSASSNPDECARSNFVFPHRDTFCETRSADRDSFNCPGRAIHQGIDINAGDRSDCLALRDAKRAIRNGSDPSIANLIPVLAVTDALVTYIGSYTVDLSPVGDRSISKFRYLHLNMRTLTVAFGDFVREGDVIGYYYNDFGDWPTTFHLHLELIVFIDGEAEYVSPYASFIAAENRSKNRRCQEIG